MQEDQLVWTVKESDVAEKSDEDEEMEQERIQRLIEEDDRREKAEEAAPVPELMSAGNEQAVDIEMSGGGASDSTRTIAADPTASNNTGQVTSENSKN